PRVRAAPPAVRPASDDPRSALHEGPRSPLLHHQTMIPFNKPPFVGPELEAMKDAFTRNHVSGDGVHGRRAEKILAEAIGAKRVLLTTSCTHALEMSALLLDVGPGDEVIVPSFTFVSTVN